MKIEYLFIAINISGLILDCIGFIKIYNTKLDWVSEMNSSGFDYLNKLKYRNSKSSSELIIETVNRKIDDINSNYVSHNQKTLPYFKLVVQGVVLQITSVFLLIVYQIFFQSPYL